MLGTSAEEPTVDWEEKFPVEATVVSDGTDDLKRVVGSSWVRMDEDIVGIVAIFGRCLINYVSSGRAQDHDEVTFLSG